MWRIRTLLAGLVVLLATAPAAGAGEHRLTDGEAFDISAYRGWLLWTQYEGGAHGVLWRGSGRTFSPPGSGDSGVLGPRLGSDAGGRTVVVYQACDDAGAYPGVYRDCRLVRHTLQTGAERTLLSDPESGGMGRPDIAQGNLALSLRDDAETSRRSLALFRPGAPRVRLSRDDPTAIDMESGRLAYVASRVISAGDFEVARAVDLRARRPRYRTLAAAETTGQDGRIPGSVVTSFTSAATDGRYAYWLRSSLRDTYASSAFEVFRADLRDPAATVHSLWLERPASSIAVARGNVYYTAIPRGDEAGVYEVGKPGWEDTGLRTPLEE